MSWTSELMRDVFRTAACVKHAGLLVKPPALASCSAGAHLPACCVGETWLLVLALPSLTLDLHKARFSALEAAAMSQA